MPTKAESQREALAGILKRAGIVTTGDTLNDAQNIGAFLKSAGMLNTADAPADTVKRAGDLLTEAEAADFLGLAPGTLSVWRSTGRYALPFVKIGARVRYKRGALQSWVESRERANGATA